MIKGYVIDQQKCFFLIILCLFIFKSNGQSPYYYDLSEENGLPSSEVYQTVQDDFGFIWIGCDAGLFRYDGIRFKQYSYSKENGRSISELKFDFSGRLWCQNFSGQIFYIENDSLRLFKDFSKELRIYPQFAVDKDGNVWIATEKYLEKLDKKGKSLLRKTVLNSNKDSVSWYDITVNNKNEIYATSFQLGLCQVVEVDEMFSIRVLKEQNEANTRKILEAINLDLFYVEEVIAGKKYQVYKLENNRPQLFLTVESNFFVYKISVDSEGDYWLSTSKGVYPINRNLKKIDTNAVLLKGDKISSFFQDKENNIWLTSLQSGIHIIPTKYLFTTSHSNSPFQDNYISALVFGMDGEIIAGTYSGKIYSFNQRQKTEMPFNHSGTYRSVKKIVPYKNGYLISRGEFGFYSKDRAIEIPSLKNIRDFCVLKDTLFFITSHASGYFPLSTVLKSKDSLKLNYKVIQQKAGRSVTSDSIKNAIFFASNDGVFQYSFGKLNSVEYNKERISAGKLGFVHGKLWIASVNEGFYSFNYKTTTKEEGINHLLKGKRIKTFTIYKDVIWVATDVCLNKINIKSLSAEYYDLSDGLMSKEINDILITDEKVYLATNKGIINFLAKTSSVNKVKPKIKITEVKVNDSIIENNYLQFLKHFQKKLSIRFITTCFRARGNFSYKYRLLGLDSNWTITPATNNEVIFPSLPSGNFMFEVKAINEDGVESEKAATLQFIIKKPFWQMWWFYLLIGVLGILLTGIISLIIIKNIKRKSQTKNDLVTSQLTAIRAQMNPHFMYNTLNSIQDLILKSDIKNTNYYLSKFSTLMRKILEFSENENVLLEEEMEMLNSYLELEKLRFGNEFQFKIQVDQRIITSKTFFPSLIIQPFVENAIKHGLLHKKGEKNVIVTFTKISNGLRVEIHDNGVGRKRSAEIKSRGTIYYKSFATGAVQKRLELLNSSRPNPITFQTIDLHENEKPIGTKVILEIT